MFTAVLSICKVFTYLASRIYCLEPFNNGSEQYKTKTLIFFFFFNLHGTVHFLFKNTNFIFLSVELILFSLYFYLLYFCLLIHPIHTSCLLIVFAAHVYSSSIQPSFYFVNLWRKSSLYNLTKLTLLAYPCCFY